MAEFLAGAGVALISVLIGATVTAVTKKEPETPLGYYNVFPRAEYVDIPKKED